MFLPIGLITNCLSVLVGGLAGTALKQVVPDRLRDNLPMIFGVSSMSIAVTSIIKVHSMTPVVLACLTGFSIGQLIHLEDRTKQFFSWLVRTLHLGGRDIDMEFYITAVALFCCSGFGWYCALTEGINGDPSLFFSKSVLDFFTALVFASTLGLSLCAIPAPQAVILALVLTAGRLLAPLLNPVMFADLSACGGVLTLAAGLRVSKIKMIPVVDMMPALILVMPFSAAWAMLMG